MPARRRQKAGREVAFKAAETARLLSLRSARLNNRSTKHDGDRLRLILSLVLAWLHQDIVARLDPLCQLSERRQGRVGEGSAFSVCGRRVGEFPPELDIFGR